LLRFKGSEFRVQASEFRVSVAAFFVLGEVIGAQNL
jgi:hypothetical protein